jgi:dienelactone hydrolase
MAVRTAALPGLLGLRWANRALASAHSEMPIPERSAKLALKVALDEFFFATEAASGSLTISPGEWRRVRREIEVAHKLFDKRGWLADPVAFHHTPPPLLHARETKQRVAHWNYEQVSFDSGYAPSLDAPGRDRFQGYTANRTAHAYLLRHAGAQRPWVVCVPGYRMGRPAVDFAGFRAQWLHKTLGLNVAIFVMPFHGPRTVGRRGGDGYLSGDFLDTNHAQSQAVWDLRRLIGWLRRQGAPAIGVHGVSLGGYTTALLAALEPNLERVVLGIPAACLMDLARANVPRGLLRAAEWLGFPVTQIEEAMKVVSPVAMPARVAKERRFIYAGTADQLAPPEHAFRLWNHWDRPKLLWYQGGHVSYLMEPTVRNLLREALSARGMLDSVRDVERESERAAAIQAQRRLETPRDFSLALAAQA